MTLEPHELAALLAGAKARGLVEAFTLLGIPVLLLDRDGNVLHAAPEALASLSGTASLEGDRLVGAAGQGAAIAALLAGRTGSGGLRCGPGGGHRLRAFPILPVPGEVTPVASTILAVQSPGEDGVDDLVRFASPEPDGFGATGLAH